jgi:hypothetical protein
MFDVDDYDFFSIFIAPKAAIFEFQINVFIRMLVTTAVVELIRTVLDSGVGENHYHFIDACLSQKSLGISASE